jgi:hypothetical protein
MCLPMMARSLPLYKPEEMNIEFREITMKINFTKILASAALAGSILLSGTAMAQSPYYQNNRYQGNNRQYDQYSQYRANYFTQKRTMTERFQNQKARIADGQRDGSLTWRETSNLKSKLSSLERELAATTRYGYITPQQYAHFEFELDQMSRTIYQAKHDYDNRYNRNNRNVNWRYNR